MCYPVPSNAGRARGHCTASHESQGHCWEDTGATPMPFLLEGLHMPRLSLPQGPSAATLPGSQEMMDRCQSKPSGC